MITVKKKGGLLYDNSELLEFCCGIIEIFEEFLDERGIVIENDEKEQDPDGACNIYGTDYGELEKSIEEFLYHYGMVEETNVED